MFVSACVSVYALMLLHLNLPLQLSHPIIGIVIHRVCDNTDQDTSKGATFALSMPLPWHFFTTCDYQLMKLIISGSADGKIKEADKSPNIKTINLYREIDSILT